MGVYNVSLVYYSLGRMPKINNNTTTMKTTLVLLFLSFLSSTTLGSCVRKQSTDHNSVAEQQTEMEETDSTKSAIAVFGTGCFWCTEALFETLDGVIDVVSGYSGGQTPNPDYKSVSMGSTGHAECVKITYDPSVISYTELLQAFFKSHDPTSLNRQGADVGTQYRSVIFYTNAAQKTLAEQITKELNTSGAYDKPIVTEISPLDKFHLAEVYHQDYYVNNPYQGYCAVVIAPKLEKFKQVFKDKLK